jgi:hypothetical protein
MALGVIPNPPFSCGKWRTMSTQARWEGDHVRYVLSVPFFRRASLNWARAKVRQRHGYQAVVHEAAKASACVSWVHGCTMDHNHHKKYHNHHKNIVFGTNILNLRSAFLNSALTFFCCSCSFVDNRRC